MYLNRSVVGTVGLCLSAAVIPVHGSTLQAQVTAARLVLAATGRVSYDLELDRAVYKRHEPVPIRTIYQNAACLPVTLWMSGFWPNHQILVTQAGGMDVGLTELGRECRDAYNPAGPRRKNYPVVLEAGRAYVDPAEIDLSQYFHLQKGEYKVRVIYDDRQGPTPTRIMTPWLDFSIE